LIPLLPLKRYVVDVDDDAYMDVRGAVRCGVLYLYRFYNVKDFQER